MHTPLRLSFAAAVVVLTLASVNVAGASAVTCDRVASVGGSSTAAGTVSDPFASVQQLADSLQPGQTGCLRAGVYEEDVTIRHGGTAAAPITIRSYPGETATLVGRLRLAQGADYTTISDLKLVGIEHGHECSRLCASPTVDANHTTWVRDDVTNDHVDTICFLLGDSGGVYGTADDTTIEADRIHDCGALPATNYDHGIYVEESHGSTIIDNLIYDNADRGIQLYPQAIGTLIRGNVIDANGEGVDFGASGQQSSNDNLVEDNVIANSNVLYNVLSAYGAGDQVGTGNVVRDNCIGGGAYDNAANPGGIRFDHTGFELEGNVLTSPAFVDPANGDFWPVPGSPCAGIIGVAATAGVQIIAPPQGSPPHQVIAPPQGSPPQHSARNNVHRPGLNVTIRAGWSRRGGRRVARIVGHLIRRSVGPRAASDRCEARRRVIMRVLRRGRWIAVGWGRTRANCAFTTSAWVGTVRKVRLEAVVVGAGASNIVTIRARRGVRRDWR